MFSILASPLARRTRVSALALIILTLGAGPALAGVLIGNPIVCRVKPSPGDSLSSATGHLDEYELDDCNGKTVTVTVDDTVDLLAGEEWTVPSDDWCTLTLRFDGGLSVSGNSRGTYTESTGDVLVLDRVSGSPDGFALADIGLSAATVRASALVE